MKKIIDLFRFSWDPMLICKSIVAGMFIGIGASMKLSVSNPIVGAFLFSLGLLSVLWFEANLYTGKVGYYCEGNPLYLKSILLFNTVGALIFGALNKNFITESNVIIQGVLNDNSTIAFVKAVVCGIFMFMAVDAYKRKPKDIGSMLIVVMCVMGFILTKSYHSIATIAYFGLTDYSLFSGKLVGLILAMVLGNGLGSIVAHWLIKYGIIPVPSIG